MEVEGLVSSRTEQNEGNPQRNVFTITQKGRNELTECLMQSIEQSPVLLERLLKLYFAKNIPAQCVIQQPESEMNKYKMGLEECMKAEQELIRNEKIKEYDGYLYWQATVRYRISDAQFRIRWCKETIESIKIHKSILII